MNATLYLPHQPPQAVPTEGLTMPDSATGFVGVPEQVSALMGCVPELIDVLASGPQYVAYSIFDFAGPVNHAAMVAMTEISGVIFTLEEYDTVLCGPILIVRE